MKTKMIHVRPATGFRILNPFNKNAELPKEGDVMPDDAYWRRRATEGGVIITDPNAPTN